jgi:hypothetical protein
MGDVRREKVVGVVRASKVFRPGTINRKWKRRIHPQDSILVGSAHLQLLAVPQLMRPRVTCATAVADLTEAPARFLPQRFLPPYYHGMFSRGVPVSFILLSWAKGSCHVSRTMFLHG